VLLTKKLNQATKQSFFYICYLEHIYLNSNAHDFMLYLGRT